MNCSSLPIACIQMVSSENFNDNLNAAISLIREATNDGALMVVLPEYFAIMAQKETDKFEYVEKHKDGKVQAALSRLAQELSVWIIAGSHPIESSDPSRPYGRSYVFNSAGEVVTWYDKIHLFDVVVGDDKNRYCESRYTLAGTRTVSFDSPWGKIGLAICYDLRFPELFRELQDEGCILTIIPAAFTYKTGKEHWELLLRARAVENLCYVVAAAQGGKHANGRETWGHSSIISPWGELMSTIEFGAGFCIQQIDFSQQAQLRKEFPVLEHKKL